MTNKTDMTRRGLAGLGRTGKLFELRMLRVLIVTLALVGAQSGAAQEPPPSADSSDLSAKATDPTAALMSFQINDWYTASYHDVDDASLNQIVLRAAIPFKTGSLQHIFRVTQPYVASSPNGGGHGLSDTTVFDLVTFDQSWGRVGVGLTASLPTGESGFTSDKWTAGPALGFVNSATKGFNWGLFAQTFFSYAGKSSAADVGIVNVQPIASMQLGRGRSLSLGNSALVYDTRNSRWTSLALGTNYGQVISMFGHKWRPNVEIDYDFRNLTGNQEWIFRVGIVLLIPSG